VIARHLASQGVPEVPVGGVEDAHRDRENRRRV
jgi:hypothetical protein